MYEIQITRAGVNMSQKKAAEFIANGYRVTVIAVGGPHEAPSNCWAEIMSAGSTSGPSRARVNFAPMRSLDAEGASVVASVAVVASEVAMTADRLLAARDAANA
jgi:hypothetical protein